MKTRTLLLAGVAIAACVAVTAYAADADLSKITCPVSGRAVKADATVDYKGGQAYFCCKGCPKAFAAKTAKYATKANMQLVQTGQATQQKCPISGGKNKDGTEATVAGVSLKFCCNKCQGKVKGAEGDAQLELVFSDKAFGKGFTVAAAEEEEK